MKRILTLTLAALLAFCLLTGCASPAATPSAPPAGNKTPAPAAGGRAVVNYGGGTPLSIDPALNAASAGSNVLKLAHAGLMGYQLADGKPVLKEELAESYTVSGDKLTYTFKLRGGLKWSDGSDFKPSEIVYSWNRAVDPALGADYQYMFSVVEGYSETAPALNISADDAAGTFTVVLGAPAPYFPELCAFPAYFPVKESAVDPDGAWATKPESYIGMGAFAMTDYRVDDRISFKKNPNYWNAGNVKLNGVDCILSEDNAAILASFETGACMYFEQPDPSEFERLKAAYGSQFVIGNLLGTYFVQFNVYKDLSPVGGAALSANDQALARNALSNMINRLELVENVTRGGQAPAVGYVPHISDGFNADFRSVAPRYFTGTGAPSSANAAYTEDQVKGMQTLIDLGYAYTGSVAGGDFKVTNFPAIEYSLNLSGANQAIIEYIQAVWGGFGVTVTVNSEAWGTLQQKVIDGAFDASRMGWIADYNDAINFLDMFVGVSGNNHTRLGKDAGTYGGGTSVTGGFGTGAHWGLGHNQTWADAYETLISDIRLDASLTPEARAAKIQEAEAVLLDTGCIMPLYYYTLPYMLSDKLQNIMKLPTGDVLLTYASVAA